MAKKKVSAPINKSEKIRDYAAKHPNAKPKEMADALTKSHGVEFTPAAVSTTLFNAKKKEGKPASKRGRKSKATGTSSLDLALEFAKGAGGLDEAEKALAKLREIKEKL